MNRNHRFSCTTIRKALMAFVVLAIIALCGCSHKENKETLVLEHRYATKEEGRSLLLENEAYYKGLSQNEIEYKMQKKGAEIDEFVLFAKEQVLDFTDEETALLNGFLRR